MPYHYPSFNKHFPLSKRDKSKVDTNRVRNIQPKYCLLHNQNLAGEFGTHVEDSFLDGMYQNLSF